MLKTVKRIFETIKKQKNNKTIKKQDLIKHISIQAGASEPTINTYIKFFQSHKLMSNEKNSPKNYTINWDNINEMLKQ